MSTATGSEKTMLAELASQFSAGELEGKQEERDRYPFAPFFEVAVSKAAQVGFLALTLPEEMGGSGGGLCELTTVLEIICRTDASLGCVMFTDSMAQQVLLLSGSDELLSSVYAGDRGYPASLLAFCSFSDPNQLAGDVRAVQDGGGYRLFGSVPYLVLGNVAGSAVIFAPVEGSDRPSCFLVDLAGVGVQRSEPVLSLGLRACPAVDVTLNAAAGRLVGREGRGGEQYREAADWMSAAAAAMASGVMRGSFDEALSYARRRRQGGREIVDWSEVRMILAGMAVKVEVSGMLVDGACLAMENGEPGWRQGSRAAAMQVQEMACGLTTDGIQVLGGNGYMKEYGQEKRFRDAGQIQALLGLAPMKKLEFMDRIVDGDAGILMRTEVRN